MNIDRGLDRIMCVHGFNKCQPSMGSTSVNLLSCRLAVGLGSFSHIPYKYAHTYLH